MAHVLDIITHQAELLMDAGMGEIAEFSHREALALS
jgi:hypothetical protein